MMYVREIISDLTSSPEIRDVWINPYAVKEIRAYGDGKAKNSDMRSVLVMSDGERRHVEGSAYAMQAWWWEHVKQQARGKDTNA